MHGLINKALESFLGDTYGSRNWQSVLDRAALGDQIGADGFDSLMVYPDDVTHRLLSAAEIVLERPRETLLEDLGTYLVSHPRCERLRRLFRFGGSSYTDFLRSLEDLPGRARLAVPDLDLPALSLEDGEHGQFRLTCRGCPPGFGQVLLGILRAMGDDYGALVVLELQPVEPLAPGVAGASGCPVSAAPQQAGAGPAGGLDATLLIAVHDPWFHEGRGFVLAAMEG